MVQTGQKRGPGRPSKHAPAPKKQRLSTTITQVQPSPAVESPIDAPPDDEKKIPRLPAKIVDGKPLPTLSEPLPLPLSDEEYQSIAASAVLSSSLDRSRLRWVHDGVFERYWMKPETGKHAKPPPPNNPELKWMKHRGHCRIRIEPHIFECDVYVEEKVKPQPPPKQYVHANTYAQQYRPPVPNQQHHAQSYNQPFQNRALPPAHQQGGQGTPANARSLPPFKPSSPMNQPPPPQQQIQAPQTPQGPAASNPALAQQSDKKPSPDPVISMLASRASSDPELKALMKEVAAGNANQGQLQIFQRHIDELTAIVQKQRKAEEERLAKEQKSNVIRFEGSADGNPAPQVHHPHQHIPPRPYQPPPQPPPPQPPPPTYRQPTWTPPAPLPLPVILGFTTPGATEDRFLFPQHSILESLSPQHTLVSFIITCKGSEAKDSSGLDLQKEYWQPITMMVEVAYGREEILACIRRWVKPAEEVRTHMEEVMSRCERVPQTYLALRLPFKSTVLVEVEDTTKENTPVVEEKTKPKSSLKQAKKAVSSNSATMDTPEVASAKPGESTIKDGDAPPQAKAESSDHKPTDISNAENGTISANKDPSEMTTGAPAIKDADEANRSKRPVRKSVRISEP